MANSNETVGIEYSSNDFFLASLPKQFTMINDEIRSLSIQNNAEWNTLSKKLCSLEFKVDSLANTADAILRFVSSKQ